MSFTALSSAVIRAVMKAAGCTVLTAVFFTLAVTVKAPVIIVWHMTTATFSQRFRYLNVFGPEAMKVFAPEAYLEDDL